MSDAQLEHSLTSNDLLHRLIAKHSQAEVNYQTVAQSAEDVRNIENAPSIKARGDIDLAPGR